MADTPLDVVGGGLIGGTRVALKFKSGIVSTFSLGISDKTPRGEGGSSLLLISAF